MKHLISIIFLLSTTLNLACTENGVTIHSYILRDRVVVTDHVFLKKALYVAFSYHGQSNLKAKGKVFANGKLLTESSTIAFTKGHSNFVFDLPGEIPDGIYKIDIDILNDKKELITKGSASIDRSDLRSTNEPKPQNPVISFEEVPFPDEPEYFTPTQKDINKGYITFSKSPLEYVLPVTRPQKEDVIDSISIKVVKNEFEPITFSVYPLRDLGNVTISVDDLIGHESNIPKDKIKLAYVEPVQEILGAPPGKYRMFPKLIKPGNQVEVEKGKCQRFWLTIRIDSDVIPGDYSGEIQILPQNAEKTIIPLNINVAPVVLEDIPGIDYFMLMTYEFTELTMPWSKEDKEKIYKSACNILRDYKDHGMTTLCFHSPFVYITKEDGAPNLDDIFAALRAARDVGFKRPIIWYMGHLIQTSKPNHPGNIKGFDKEIHTPRLKKIVNLVSKYSKENNCPEVIFLPIDEADDSYQDYKGKRQNITPLLLDTIKSVGGKTMITAVEFEEFKEADYFCTSKLNKSNLQKAHDNGSHYWIYNNKVTTNCENSAYARHVYGIYAWLNRIDGITSWTFQNTQNASGYPTLADAFGNDLYLAYPDPVGPLSTLDWEALREGIDDYRLVYQFIKRVNKMDNAHTCKLLLNQFRQRIFDIDEQDAIPSDFSFLKQFRSKIINCILDSHTENKD